MALSDKKIDAVTLLQWGEMNCGKEDEKTMTAKTTDKELLELAAKAAGIPIIPCTCGDQRWPFKHDEAISGKHGHWSPLFDDGDESRLEAVLGFWVSWYPAMVLVGPEPCFPATGMAYAQYFDKHKGDKQAARRRAGVLAAAEIGKAMP